MGQQNGQEAGQKQLGQGETFSASSLLDQRSLPDWIREEEQPSAPVPPAAYAANTQASPSPQAAQQQGPQANAVWQGQQPPAPGSGNNSQMPAGPNHSISASSFIDMNSLPPWLRQNEGSSSAQQGLVQRGPQRPVPPRGESVRVPNRPRSEMAQSEGNEVAANVFASMLGVASTAPNFPQQAQSGVQGSYGPQGFQGAQSSMSPVGNPPPSQGMPYGNMGGMGGMQVQPPSGTMPQQPSSGYMQGGYQNQGNYPMGNATMMPSANMGGPQPAMQSFGPNQYPQNTGNMGNARNIGNSAMMGEQQPHAKPAKRGLFEAIRSWLSRS